MSERTGNIYLCGMIGSGKTTIGRRLAEELEWPFIDLDREMDRILGYSFHRLVQEKGWVAFRELPIDAFPDVTNSRVTVISQAPTLSPLEIEQLVTYPIEQACAGLPRSSQLRSLSKFGLSMVTVVFEDGTDLYFARQLVMERISAVREELPEGAPCGLGPISTGLGEVFQYTLESPARDLMELRTLQDWVLRPILRTVPEWPGSTLSADTCASSMSSLTPERSRAST